MGHVAKGLKGGGSQTVSQTADPEVLRRYTQAANQGYSSQVPGFEQNLNTATGTAQNGLAALGGDQAAMGKLMNPYQQQVIGNLNSQYDRLRSKAALGVNDDATRAGAFGGSRQALTIGERQGALDQQQMQDTGNLLYQGYNNAVQQAGQGAQIGQNADQYYGGLEQEKRDWATRQAQTYQQAYGAGTGTTTPTQGGGLLGTLGGLGMTFAGLGGVKGITSLFHSK